MTTIRPRADLRSGSWMTDANHVSASYRLGFPPETENTFNSFGFRVASVPAPSLTGDFNGNGVLDAADIDMLTGDVQDPALDVTSDGVVNQDDRVFWVHDLANTWFGDADLNGEFVSSDIVVVFVAGKYDTGQEAGWAEGDWDGDGVFSSGDLITALVDVGYEKGQLTDGVDMPEPGGWLLLILGVGLLLTVRKGR